ncbi:TetR/AcrR family transcriptional regulator [Streptomyces sp. CRN 30]|uniref:TetR/AcrR family transcriptional regulator n=1 Tax=Streptomyces sp. CRN 30 TaxID=3075613 RepID=UPI002A838B60|nr:TetR/AcrR family transcriptional regulator [Streptomyces sp. CRN 30]
MSTPPLIRPYRGTPAEDRVARRRAALLEAALRVFEAEGWNGVSARRVCEEAGLTRRYFYESFEDVDALLGALLGEITGEVRAAVRAVVADSDAPLAELTRRAVSTGLEVLLSTPVKGRFVAGARGAGGAVAAQQAAGMDDLASTVEATFAARGGETPPVGTRQARVAAIGAVGAVLRIVDSWLNGEIDATREEAVAWSTGAALAVLGAVAAPLP